MRKQFVALGLALGIGLPAGHADDWRQFRGNHSSGVSPEAELPWDLESAGALQWQVPLPGRGLSGPIVVGKRVILTASSGHRDDRLHIMCFSTQTGELEWRRQFNATGRTICNRTMCMATPQPCSDGVRIFAYYSCNDVLCLDMEGTLIWHRGLEYDHPNASSSVGMSSSPIVAHDTLVLQLDNDSQSFAIGLDALTGETRWKIDREKTAIWASPTLFRSSDDSPAQVILQSTKSLMSLDQRTGRKNWEIEQRCEDVASTTVAGELLVAPLRALSALRPGIETTSPKVLWSDAKLTPDTPTPVAYLGKVYVLKGSVLTCVDLISGEVHWRMRLNTKSISASPLAGAGHLYVVDEAGLLQTIRLEDGMGEIVSRMELGEKIMATPALAGGALYLRSDHHLWKFAKTQ